MDKPTDLGKKVMKSIQGVSVYTIFVFLLFYCSPFIDSLTGFLIYSDIIPVGGGNLSPSVVLRLILFGLGFFFITINQFRVIFLILLYIVTFEFIGYAAIHHQLPGFFVGINYSFKTVYAIMLCLVLYNFIHTQRLSSEELLIMIRTTVLLYALVIIVPSIFGLGVSTYGKNSTTWGKIGFLASGNGAGAVMGMGSLISLFVYLQRKRTADLWVYIVTIITCYIIATKGTLLFTAVNLLLVFWYMKWRYKLLSVLLVFGLISVLSDQIIGILLQSIDVIKFRYERAPNFILFLTSGRIDYLSYALEQYNLDGFSVFRIFFGLGAYQSFRATDFNFASGSSQYYLEAELFDVFFIYGVAGVVFYLFFFLFPFWNGIKNKNFFLVIPWMLCAIYSMFAGHMLFNGMSILVIVVLFNLLLVPKVETTILNSKIY